MPALLTGCPELPAEARTQDSAPNNPPQAAQRPDPTADRLAWWREARFGLFLHWGLYAVPAGRWGGETGHGEWIRETAHIPLEEYDTLRERFDPREFDARAWARLAREAGMGYVVITTKHHDGFALFDSEVSDFDVATTPFRRDVMRELSAACAEQGLRMGWYHSIMDWHHPDYLPRRSWEARPSEGADFARYKRYLFAQVEELLTGYGPIGVMWFDGEWESTWTHQDGAELYALCRRLQPDVIVNNRVDKGRGGMAGMTAGGGFLGDFGTPEQEVPSTGFPGVDWESCMTMNHHWGYNELDRDFKSTRELVRTLAETASKGGNLLLNVGPTALGVFPPECVERLQEIGAWMSVHGEAIRGTSASPFDELAFGRCTQRSLAETTRLYLFVLDWPAQGRLRVPGLGNAVLGARLLEAPEASLDWQREGSDVLVQLPPQPSDPWAPVLALDVQGAPVVYEAPRIVAAASVLVDRLDVRLETRSKALELRYTLDGSEPVQASAAYRGPIELRASALVQARSFHQGRAVSAISQARFEKVAPIAASVPDTLEPGLRHEHFSGDWNELPLFMDLRADDAWIAPGIALNPAALPGPAQEHQGLRVSGWIQAPRPAVYRFRLESDDGSRLLVAGRTVVDNDGLHSLVAKEGVLPLAAGWHPVLVEYFNKTGGAELGVHWGALGEELEPLLGSHCDPAGSR